MVFSLLHDEFFHALLQSYSAYFDIDKNVKIHDVTYAAVAEFHSRSERYVLVKKAKLWAAETNEYVYFFRTETLDDSLLQLLIRNVTDATLKKIRPHNEHMCTHMSLFVLAERIDSSAASKIQQIKYRKNFLFSLHGWTSLRIAAVDIANQSIVTNTDGKEIKRRLKKLLNKYNIFN